MAFSISDKRSICLAAFGAIALITSAHAQPAISSPGVQAEPDLVWAPFPPSRTILTEGRQAAPIRMASTRRGPVQHPVPDLHLVGALNRPTNRTSLLLIGAAY